MAGLSGGIGGLGRILGGTAKPAVGAVDDVARRIADDMTRSMDEALGRSSRALDEVDWDKFKLIDDEADDVLSGPRSTGVTSFGDDATGGVELVSDDILAIYRGMPGAGGDVSNATRGIGLLDETPAVVRPPATRPVSAFDDTDELWPLRSDPNPSPGPLDDLTEHLPTRAAQERQLYERNLRDAALVSGTDELATTLPQTLDDIGSGLNPLDDFTLGAGGYDDFGSSLGSFGDGIF